MGTRELNRCSSPREVSERVTTTGDHLIQRRIFGHVIDDLINLIRRKPAELVESDTHAVLALTVSTVGSTGVRQKHQQPSVELANSAEQRGIYLLVEQVAFGVRRNVFVLGIECVHLSDRHALLGLLLQIWL